MSFRAICVWRMHCVSICVNKEYILLLLASVGSVQKMSKTSRKSTPQIFTDIFITCKFIYPTNDQ